MQYSPISGKYILCCFTSSAFGSFPLFKITLRPRQKCRRHPDDIFKCIFLNENLWITIKMSLKFVNKGPIDDVPALFQTMSWPGDKPLSKPMIVSLVTYICATQPNELTSLFVLVGSDKGVVKYRSIYCNVYCYWCRNVEQINIF